jgi:hypothetical protein
VARSTGICEQSCPIPVASRPDNECRCNPGYCARASAAAASGCSNAGAIFAMSRAVRPLAAATWAHRRVAVQTSPRVRAAWVSDSRNSGATCRARTMLAVVSELSMRLGAGAAEGAAGAQWTQIGSLAVANRQSICRISAVSARLAAYARSKLTGQACRCCG